MAKNDEKTVCPNCNGEKVMRNDNFPLPFVCDVCNGTGEVDAK